MLLTAALMLDWMGEEDPAAARCAQALRDAVGADLAEHGVAGRGTEAVGRAILQRLG